MTQKEMRKKKGKIPLAVVDPAVSGGNYSSLDVEVLVVSNVGVTTLLLTVWLHVFYRGFLE